MLHVLTCQFSRQSRRHANVYSKAGLNVSNSFSRANLPRSSQARRASGRERAAGPGDWTQIPLNGHLLTSEENSAFVDPRSNNNVDRRARRALENFHPP